MQKTEMQGCYSVSVETSKVAVSITLKTIELT
jgi:hypothetical protein